MTIRQKLKRRTGTYDYVPRSWLYIALGVSTALIILGVYAIITAQAALATGRTITTVGEVVCLPHKKPWFGLFDGTETEECRTGFVDQDGNHYGLNFLDSEAVELLVDDRDSDRSFTITGILKIPAPYEGLDRYDIVGSIDIVSAIEEAERVDFGVALPERDIVVKKGETVKVPVTIETLGNLEIVLNLAIEPGKIETPDDEVPDASELALSLDRESVVLTRDNIAKGKARIGDNIEIGSGWLITDVGFLTITALPTAASGTHEYVVTATYTGHSGGTGIGTGQLIAVTVTK
jgi:hypothetical protein